MRHHRLQCWKSTVMVAAVIAASPAAANDGVTLLSYFTHQASSQPELGKWSTTVIAATDAVVARDPAWTAVVVVRTPLSNLTTGSIPAPALNYGPRITGTGHELKGNASYYFEDQLTATGERYDKRAMTAAHKTLPFGTRVRVTRPGNGKSVVVRINDRGPYKDGRVIDLSERAAEGLDMTGAGVTPVTLEVLGQ